VDALLASYAYRMIFENAEPLVERRTDQSGGTTLAPLDLRRPCERGSHLARQPRRVADVASARYVKSRRRGQSRFGVARRQD
jgi:hypothetical protein